MKQKVKYPDEPPREVWVVSTPFGTDFVSDYKHAAMEHAAEVSEKFPELGPYRVCKYLASPFFRTAVNG